MSRKRGRHTVGQIVIYFMLGPRAPGGQRGLSTSSAHGCAAPTTRHAGWERGSRCAIQVNRRAPHRARPRRGARGETPHGSEHSIVKRRRARSPPRASGPVRRTLVASKAASRRAILAERGRRKVRRCEASERATTLHFTSLRSAGPARARRGRRGRAAEMRSARLPRVV